MATISLSYGAGSVAPSYYYNVSITKQLCAKTAQPPVFIPVFTLISYTSVGTGEYMAKVNVQGVITYSPCGSCCANTQTINQDFAIPFYSATAPSSVAVSGGSSVNTISLSGCAKCSNTMVSNVPLTLTIENT